MTINTRIFCSKWLYTTLTSTVAGFEPYENVIAGKIASFPHRQRPQDSSGRVCARAIFSIFNKFFFVFRTIETYNLMSLKKKSPSSARENHRDNQSNMGAIKAKEIRQ